MSRQQDFLRRKIRQRFLFSSVTLVLYFLFVLNWLPAGAWLSEGMGSSAVTGGIVMFVMLIFIFIFLELLFLRQYRAEERSQRD